MAKRPPLSFEEAVFDESLYKEQGLDYVALPTSRSAFFLTLGVALLITGAVLFKAGIFIFKHGTAYALRAEGNINREIYLPTYRAEITDRFGEVLAEHSTSFTVFLNIPTLFKDAHAPERIVSSLSSILETDHAKLLAVVRQADLNKDNWIPIARNITSQEAIAIRALRESSLEVLDDFERAYIDSRAFSHVIGYTGAGKGNRIEGISGVESLYDPAIRGEEGRYVFYQDAVGNIVGKRAVEDPQPADPFRLTIDGGLQRYFYERFSGALRTLGRTAGVGIALNPQTGEILSLLSFPTFDANVFVDAERRSERASLLTDPAKPLFNRAISGVYSPGSTIKPLVALAALKADVFSPSSRIFSDGALEIPNPYNAARPSIFLDWKANGWVDVRSALARSSNIYFGLAGGGLPTSVGLPGFVEGSFNRAGLGIDALRKAWEYFGFGKKTGVDMPYEAIGSLPSIEEKQKRGEVWRLGDTYNVSIGQGDLLVTPLQLASFAASLGNGGVIYRPFLNASLGPEVLVDYGQEFSEELAVVREGLRDGVRQTYGTSYILHDLPLSSSGKTGSAQTNNNTRVNALFIGYAPAENPEIAVLILVENAREGSLNTLPIAKDVFRWYYEHRLTDN